MLVCISSRMQSIRRRVLLGCKQLTIQRCVTTFVGQHWKSVIQNMPVKQNYSFIRCLSTSVPLNGAKQLADKMVQTEDETPPAEILANLSPEDEKRLKVLKLEYDVFMSTGLRVPDHVGDKEWVHLLYNCRSRFSREGYYRFLFKREKTVENQLQKRAANRLAMEEKRKLMDQQKQDGTYEFLNTFQMYTREVTMNSWYTNNLCYALMNGPHLVFDFSFEDVMKQREIINLVRQIQLCHGDNKVDREPFHFHFCNLPPDSKTAKLLQPAIPNVDELPYTITDSHYLQCYDRSRIVYLSPNAPNCMTEFSYDDVYVIGCIVDKGTEKPLTFARAKEERIRCARFPFDQHVRWVQGSKSLSLNHVVNILLTLKRTNDWEKAFTRNVPTRKFRAD